MLRGGPAFANPRVIPELLTRTRFPIRIKLHRGFHWERKQIGVNWCMSSRREDLIIILALLQRKTLIEPKNRTLKCLRRRYSTVRSMKNVAVLTEDGAFVLFFRPRPGGFDSSRVPIPGNLPSKAKKMVMTGGQPGGGGGWAQLELTDVHYS